MAIPKGDLAVLAGEILELEIAEEEMSYLWCWLACITCFISGYFWGKDRKSSATETPVTELHKLGIDAKDSIGGKSYEVKVP